MDGSVEEVQDVLMVDEPPVQTFMREGSVPQLVPEQSVADQLRSEFAVAKGQRTKDFRIPGYEPHALWITCRALDDYTEMRKMILEVVKKTRYLPQNAQAEQQIALGVETMIRACTGSYVVKEDGTRVEIGKKLGLDLHDYIFPPVEGAGTYRPMSDAEAVHVLFPWGTSSIMTTAAAIDMWMKGTSLEIEESLLGE